MTLRTIFLTPALALLCACGGDVGTIKNPDGTVQPRVRYEFGGGAGHYDYAPSVIEDGYGIRYAFVCENRNPFEIIDYVYLYKGIPTADGYVWQPGTELVAPSSTGWDCIHICDPDVREFKTTWKGETYDWIMTYLGVDQWFNHNQIGLAVSKSIEGPWIKFDGNPLVPCEDRASWGVGMSTTIVKDSTTVMLFFSSTIHPAGLHMREIKLDDLDNIELGEARVVPGLGSITYPAMSRDNIYMASSLWVSKELTGPPPVGDICSLTYKPLSGDLDEDLFSEPAEWVEIGHVGPEESGFPRNHNPGILTDTRGYMLDGDELVMYFTPAVNGENWLWSYDLWSATFDLKTYFR